MNAKLQRWMSKTANYRCEVVYHPGEENVLADHLSRNPAYEQLPITGALVWVEHDNFCLESFADDYSLDEDYAEVYEAACSSQPEAAGEYRVDPTTGLLYKQDKLGVPHDKIQELLRQFHVCWDTKNVGHT